MMSVHDALQAWQAGEISASRAMALTGAENVLELYAFAASSGVEIREPNPHEFATAKAASDAVSDLSPEAGHGGYMHPFSGGWFRGFDAVVRDRLRAWVKDSSAASMPPVSKHGETASASRPTGGTGG